MRAIIFFSDLLLIFIDFLFLVLPLLVMIAISTALERKVLGAMHRRRGPNVVGFFGILQPISDGLKLFTKELVLVTNSKKLLFLLSPAVFFYISLVMWSVFPLNGSDNFRFFLFEGDLSLLFLLALSTLNIYGIILSGWASNSFYAFIGALRASAQMISYEVSFSLCLLPVVLITQSFDLHKIIDFQYVNGCWNIFLVSPSALLFFISILAETNRTPFDLPEAEGELVAGFNVEYSAIFFAMFFLAEYSNMILMSALFTILFLGGWSFFGFCSSFFFVVKFFCVFFCFIWIRAILPRYRYDQLIQLGWGVILPFSMAYFLFISGTIFFLIQLL